MKKIIAIYGPPGSGKGTQAKLLEANFNFYHFDTGKYIEQLIRDPENLKNKIIQRERKKFESGELCTPSWILKIIAKKIKKMGKADFSIVLSGSPRTIFEAFGDSKNTGLIKTLEKIYRKKIYFVHLNVAAETSIYRNSNRTICSLCSAPILYKKTKESVNCPFCDSPVRRRKLDKPEIIKVRLEEYRGRTKPILERLKKMGYKINYVNAEPPPHKIYQEIVSKLKIK